MENRIDKFQKVKTYNDVDASNENNLRTAITDKDLDCWEDLLQCIKTKSALFFDRKNKTKISFKED